jgi:glycosyltransferase involved in cell wall biosynthesis
LKYVLVTAARNESGLIEHTLRSVETQTRRPERWVIVDDGSTDATPQIVERYAGRNPWIELMRRPPRTERSFAGKAHAINAAVERLRDVPFDIIGNLDADVSFDPDYMEFVLDLFERDPRLGVGGTPFTEAGGYDSARDSFEGAQYVAGPCQLFRRQCWQDIGGYVPNHAGGVDWIAVMTARMKGWRVCAAPQKRFHHHRSMGTAQRGVLASMFSYGEKDYYLGGALLWQLFRCSYRAAKRPYLLGGLALWLGYSSAALRRLPRAVSPELMRFHRAEQMRKLRTAVRSALRLRRVDGFALSASDGTPSGQATE